jgi:hypothetical protein
VRLGVLGGACQIALYPTVGYHPIPRIFGNRLVGVNSVGAPLSVFRFTLQGFMNQLIVGLSPLSETA